ncbi:WSC domain-containing protein [Colletotrichum abscissum]|uniref:WSC domain-containing protein n=1 Tax=Colletotrichum abscissum TaxID=1671311 RepID=UPI0027D65209|nr:WSC domain-containing protein [Colletotrichum abscissum]KAI3549357.1 WSC domain-containing protein [Colletotrichum filicis]KAK1475311.1 WSC domain-containing protein [Colletotrichum abscissum]
MTFTQRTTRCLGIFALALSSWATMAQAAPEPEILMPRQLTQNLCSNTNTASMSANLSTWQTNGLCTDFCRDKNYAFAIVQWQSCWCSDVAPAASSEAEVSDKCNDICPGYDIEHCGSRPNYYGYLTLAKTPTSTAGSGGDSSSSSKAAASTTTQNTVTPDPETTTTSTTSVCSQKSQQHAVPTSSSSKPRSTVQTVTADGTVRTIFVTPTATGTEGATGASELTPGSQSSSNGPSTGAVVGIVVGVIAAVVAIAGLGLFLFFRRRRQQQNENDKYDEPSHRGSSAGMTGSPRNPEMVVTVDGGRWDPDASSDHRRSRLLAHDPRLDPLPRGLYVHNKSAESINTLRDDQDYSRKVHQPVLRATNPDPDT